MQKERFPDQRAGESFEDYLDRTWKNDSNLRDEFLNDFSSYKAYCKAVAAGTVRIFGQ